MLIDDRLFARARGSGSGPDLLTPIVVNDNVIDVLVTPADKAGDPAVVKMRPQTSLVQMDAQVSTGPEKGSRASTIEAVGPNRFTVRGQVPAKSQPLVRIYPVDDPAAFARALFIEALRREGVAVSASPLAAPEAELPEKDGYDKLTRVAVLQSPPLRRIPQGDAEGQPQPLRQHAAAAGGGEERQADAGRTGCTCSESSWPSWACRWRRSRSAAAPAAAIADNVTPRATVALLQGMRKRDDWPAYRAALPVLGVDGTLVDVVPSDSPAKGKVMAKTGTLVLRRRDERPRAAAEQGAGRRHDDGRAGATHLRHLCQ